MTTPTTPHLWLVDEDDDIASEWKISEGDIHFHDYKFDDNNTEVIALEAEYDHRTDVKALDWEETHRKWTDGTWKIDFAALDTAVKHFLDRGYTVTIAASEISIPSFLTSRHRMLRSTRMMMNKPILALSRSVGLVRSGIDGIDVLPNNRP